MILGTIILSKNNTSRNSMGLPLLLAVIRCWQQALYSRSVLFARRSLATIAVGGYP